MANLAEMVMFHGSSQERLRIIIARRWLIMVESWPLKPLRRE
jgi:hypothetical protein